VLTTKSRITSIVGTPFAVIADNGFFSLAYACRTGVPFGAGVGVVAIGRIGCVHASRISAAIIGAKVSVIAVNRHTRSAASIHAVVAQGTGVTIITGHVQGIEGATKDGVAYVFGAWISVHAFDGLSSAYAIGAFIGGRACVAVVARCVG